MAIKPIIVTVVITIAVLLGLYQIYNHFHRPLTHHLNADLEWLGIIDIEAGHEVTLNSILNGEDVVLVVDHASFLYQELAQKIPQAKQLSVEELFNLSNLHLFDDSADNMITAKDPIFKHLFIVKFYNNGTQDEIKSLSAAGIKAIGLDTNSINGNRTVLMTDGSHKTLFSTDKFEKNDN